MNSCNLCENRYESGRILKCVTSVEEGKASKYPRTVDRYCLAEQKYFTLLSE